MYFMLKTVAQFNKAFVIVIVMTVELKLVSPATLGTISGKSLSEMNVDLSSLIITRSGLFINWRWGLYQLIC